MKKSEQILSKAQHERTLSSADGQPLTNRTPLETITEGIQDVLNEALEEIQGGGEIQNLSILKKDLKSFKNLRANSSSPCDTGTICQDSSTRSHCQ